MAVMPGARWEPVTDHTDGVMRSHTGIVLHVNAAESYDLHNFFQSSSGESAVSSHFQVAKDGTIWQYIDTAYSAWCQGDGNADYLSIESEGEADEAATPQQITSIGLILAWTNKVHGVPLQLAERPGDRGFGWHGMGAAAGDAGWGHALCPGTRRDQRPAMLAAAAPPIPVVPVDDRRTNGEQVAYLVEVDKSTLPADVTWPGVFLTDGISLRHVEPAVAGGTDNVATFVKLGVPGPDPITYAQYKTLGGA